MLLCVNFRKFANLIFNTAHCTCRYIPSLLWKLKAMGFISYFIAMYVTVKRKAVKRKKLRYWNWTCQKSYRILYVALIQLVQMSCHCKPVVNTTTNIWLILECEDFLTWLRIHQLNSIAVPVGMFWTSWLFFCQCELSLKFWEFLKCVLKILRLHLS